MFSFLRELPKIVVSLGLILGMIAISLFLLGKAPAYLQGPYKGLREYASITAAEAGLGFDIAVPAYFPNYLTWPPAHIEGQIEPVTFSRLTFVSSRGNEEMLVIYQITPDGDDLPENIPWKRPPQAALPVTIGGFEGSLVVNTSDDAWTNAVFWRDADYYHLLTTTQDTRELLLLGRSIHP